MSDDMVSRRRLLAGAAGLTTATATAGCFGILGGSGKPDDPDEAIYVGVELTKGPFNAIVEGELDNRSSYTFDQVWVNVDFLSESGERLTTKHKRFTFPANSQRYFRLVYEGDKLGKIPDSNEGYEIDLSYEKQDQATPETTTTG
ncbi:MAG: hypothetical protein ABEJ08_03360 [Halobacteriaceae archaeon]